VSLGIGVGREVLNFYRGIAQRQGDTWPRFNMLLNGVHALMDQEYSGDINIIPSFRWYNPAKILSHLTEKELMDLMEGGALHLSARRDDSHLHAHLAHHGGNSAPLRIRRSASRRRQYHRPRASRRRPGPTRADREAMRETGPTRRAALTKRTPPERRAAATPAGHKTRTTRPAKRGSGQSAKAGRTAALRRRRASAPGNRAWHAEPRPAARIRRAQPPRRACAPGSASALDQPHAEFRQRFHQAPRASASALEAVPISARFFTPCRIAARRKKQNTR
jgi:hypothetical protein